MIVKIFWADNNIEIFDTDRYVISTVKNFHPGILGVEIWQGNRRIARRKRFCSWWYSHVTYNSARVQDEIKKIIADNENRQKDNC